METKKQCPGHGQMGSWMWMADLDFYSDCCAAGAVRGGGGDGGESWEKNSAAGLRDLGQALTSITLGCQWNAVVVVVIVVVVMLDLIWGVTYRCAGVDPFHVAWETCSDRRTGDAPVFSPLMRKAVLPMIWQHPWVDGLKAAYHAVYRWLVAYKKHCVVGMILHHVMKQGFPRLERACCSLAACTSAAALMESRFHPLNKPTIWF